MHMRSCVKNRHTCYTPSRTERHTKLRPEDVIWHHETQKLLWHNSTGTHFLGTQDTLHSGPSPAAATWRNRIVDVLIPEKIQNPPRLSASQRISRPLCAPYIKYCVHNSPQLNLILSPMKINPHPQIWGTTFFRANRRLKVVSGFSLQSFFNRKFCMWSSPLRMWHAPPSHLFWTREQIIKLLLCVILHSPVKSSPLGPNTCVLLFLNTS